MMKSAEIRGRYTYQNDQVLLSLLDIRKYGDDANSFGDLDNFRAGNTPLTTIPPSILITSYRHDTHLLELTCPFNSAEHLQAAWE